MESNERRDCHTCADISAFTLTEKPQPEVLSLIEQGKIDTVHRSARKDIEEANRIFADRLEEVIKSAVTAG